MGKAKTLLQPWRMSLSQMNDRDKVYDWVRNKDKKNGLVWLDPVRFNNNYNLMMQKSQARKKA